MSLLFICRKGFPLTYSMSMYSMTSFLTLDGSGTCLLYLLRCFGATILPRSMGSAIPYIIVARSTSSSLTLQFCISFRLIYDFSVLSGTYPRFFCSSRALFARANCLLLNFNLFSDTVLRNDT